MQSLYRSLPGFYYSRKNSLNVNFKIVIESECIGENINVDYNLDVKKAKSSIVKSDCDMYDLWWGASGKLHFGNKFSDKIKYLINTNLIHVSHC